MSENTDFVIENGLLKDYIGQGGEIVIPEGVECIGRLVFKNCRSLIVSVTIPDGVKRIYSFALGGCDHLKKVSIGKGIESIASNAFAFCKSITEINLNENITPTSELINLYGRSEKLEAVYVSEENQVYCSREGALFNKDGSRMIAYPRGRKEKIYSIPSEVTEIEGKALISCKNLEVIYLPAGLKRIGKGNFSECDALTVFYFPGSVEEFDRVEIEDVLLPAPVICKDGNWELLDGGTREKEGYWKLYPNGTLKVSGFGYTNMTDEQRERLRNKVTYAVIEGGFNEISLSCLPKLQSVSIPEGVTEIEGQAFESCISLERIFIPDSVKTIGDFAFHGCESLQEVSLPEGLETLEFGVFYECEKLKEVHFRGHGRCLTVIPAYCFEKCRSLERFIFPESVQLIERGAFSTCEKLAEVSIPMGLKKIEKGAFYRCENLKSVTTQGQGTVGLSLEDYVFWGCKALKKIDLPEQSLFGKNVFGGCDSLETQGMMSASSRKYLETEGKIGIKPEEANIRWIVPRHWDYWWDVYHLRKDDEEPCYLEFACYPHAAAKAVVDEFFHLDLGNLTAAEAWCEDEMEDWESEAEKQAFIKQTQKIEAGETDYFIYRLYYPSSPNDNTSLYMNCLPKGTSLFDCKNQRGIPADYAVVFIRETKPLMPDVLCDWLEKLSPVLFGDHSVYQISADDYPNLEEVKESFHR